MAKTPAQRGSFGSWLKAAREGQYATQKQALAAYRRLAGLVISESEYAQWESGSRTPKEDNPKKLALLKFYGSSPEEVQAPQPPAPGDQSAVVAAIDRQTAAIERQSALLEQLVAAVGGGMARLDQTVAGGVLGLADSLGLLAAALGATPPGSDTAPAGPRGQRDPESERSSSRTVRP